jgi:hypothetical protein
MREKRIKEKIWEIVAEEIRNGMTFAKRSDLGDEPKGYDLKVHANVFDFYFQRTKKRIEELLEKEEAILVYQP